MKRVFIVWTAEGHKHELEISHTVADTQTVAEAWAAKFTRDYGIQHTVETRQEQRPSAKGERTVKTVVIRCPDCGAPLDLQEHVIKGERYLTPWMNRQIEELPIRLVRVPAVAFCSACEFAIEVWPDRILKGAKP